jgi:hypothetical protein
MIRTALASLAAILVQPPLAIAYMFVPALVAGESMTPRDFLELSFYVAVFAAAFVLILGVPIFFLLRHFGKAKRTTVSFAGFGAGAIPLAIYSWPRHMEGFSSGGNWHGAYVQFVEDGVHTIYGWLSYFEGVLWWGVHGFVGALVFYLIWARMSPNYALKRDAASAAPLS